MQEVQEKCKILNLLAVCAIPGLWQVSCFFDEGKYK